MNFLSGPAIRPGEQQTAKNNSGRFYRYARGSEEREAGSREQQKTTPLGSIATRGIVKTTPLGSIATRGEAGSRKQGSLRVFSCWLSVFSNSKPKTQNPKLFPRGAGPSGNSHFHRLSPFTACDINYCRATIWH